MKKFLNKFLVGLFVCVSACVLFGCNTKTEKLSAPANVRFIQLNTSLGIQISNVLHADSYVAIIDGVEFSTKSGYIEIKDILNSPKKITVCAIAKGNDYIDSDKSKNFYFENFYTLSSPTISVKNNTLSWNEISFANLYKVYINGKMYETQKNSFSLKDFAGLGKLNIQVKASNSISVLVLDSDYSNEIVCEIPNTLSAPKIEMNNQILKIIDTNNGNVNYLAQINNQQYFINEKEVDLSTILRKIDENEIKIKVYAFVKENRSDWSNEIKSNKEKEIEMPYIQSVSYDEGFYKLYLNTLNDGFYNKITVLTDGQSTIFKTKTNVVMIDEIYIKKGSHVEIQTLSDDGSMHSDIFEYTF